MVAIPRHHNPNRSQLIPTVANSPAMDSSQVDSSMADSSQVGSNMVDISRQQVVTSKVVTSRARMEYLLAPRVRLGQPQWECSPMLKLA
jgi:hypothetical protein